MSNSEFLGNEQPSDDQPFPANTNKFGPLLLSPFGLALAPLSSHIYIVDQMQRALVRVDLVTGVRTVISGPSVGIGPEFSSPSHVVIAGTQALVTDEDLGSVMRVDLVTGARAVLSDSSIGGGVAMEKPGPIAVTTDLAQVYVLDRSLGPTLFRIESSSGNRTVVSNGSAASGERLQGPSAILLSDDGTHAVVMDSFTGSLVRIDLSTGHRIRIAGDSRLNLSTLSFLPDRKEVIGVDILGRRLLRADLMTGSFAEVSGPAKGTGQGFVKLVNAVVAPDGSVYAIDVGVGGLFKVDLTTGRRTLISHSSIGSGSSFHTVGEMALVTGAQTALVIDNGRVNQAAAPVASLNRVDLLSGRRTLLSSRGVYGRGEALEAANGMVVDATATFAFFTDSLHGLRKVDLATGDRSIILNMGMNSGETSPILGDLVLDRQPTKAYVLTNDDRILKVDLVTKEWEALPRSGEASTALGFYCNIVINASGSEAIVLNRINRSIIRVNLSSGERTLVSSGTVGADVAFASPKSLVLNADSTTAYVADSKAILRVDLSSGDRVVISSGSVGKGPMGWPREIALSADGLSAYVTDSLLNALIRVDLTTGDRVLVSK